MCKINVQKHNKDSVKNKWYKITKKRDTKTNEKRKKQMTRTLESLVAVHTHTQVGF